MYSLHLTIYVPLPCLSYATRRHAPRRNVKQNDKPFPLKLPAAKQPAFDRIFDTRATLSDIPSRLPPLVLHTLIYTRPTRVICMQSTGRMDIINNLTERRTGIQESEVGRRPRPPRRPCHARASWPLLFAVDRKDTILRKSARASKRRHGAAIPHWSTAISFHRLLVH